MTQIITIRIDDKDYGYGLVYVRYDPQEYGEPAGKSFETIPEAMEWVRKLTGEEGDEG